MREPDSDTEAAYWCFVNRDWAPGYYESLPIREKALIAQFILREAKAREKLASQN